MTGHQVGTGKGKAKRELQLKIQVRRVPRRLFALTLSPPVSVQLHRDARVFHLTRWQCLQPSTLSEYPQSWGQARAAQLQLLSFVCVCVGAGGGGGDRGTCEQCRWPCRQLPILLWQKSHLTLGSSAICFLSKEDELEAKNIAPTRVSTFSILGTYLESRHSQGGF